MLGICDRRALRLLRQPDALEQAQQVELALDAHESSTSSVGIVLDPDDDAFAPGAEPCRQAAERSAAITSNSTSDGGFQRPPGQRVGEGAVVHCQTYGVV